MSEIYIALISLIGTIVGSLTGVLASNKLSNYRIQQLENEVHKHNSLIDRVYKLETENTVQNTRLSNMETEQQRIIDDIRAIKTGDV